MNEWKNFFCEFRCWFTPTYYTFRLQNADQRRFSCKRNNSDAIRGNGEPVTSLRKILAKLPSRNDGNLEVPILRKIITRYPVSFLWRSGCVGRRAESLRHHLQMFEMTKKNAVRTIIALITFCCDKYQFNLFNVKNRNSP